MNYETIRNRFEEYRAVVGTLPMGRGIYGALIGVLDEACGGTANRYLLSKDLTGKVHTAEWDASDWYAMFKFVAPYKDELTGKWESGTPDFDRMVGVVLSHAVDQAGQIKMFEGVQHDNA